MKHLAITLSTAIIIVTAILSCGEGITEPNYPPGRRDYVWTVDTLNPGDETLLLVRIWGSSPKSIWAIASSSWSATTVWYYNGSAWRCDSIPRGIFPTALFGFSENDVWIGSSTSKIWRYFGTTWSVFSEHKISGYDVTVLNNFDGLAPRDLYAVGFADNYRSEKAKGVILHFNGGEWNNVGIPEKKMSFGTVAVDKNKTLVMSATEIKNNMFYASLYTWDGRELIEHISDYGWSHVTKLSNGEIFATLNTKIYKYNDKKFTLWRENSDVAINNNIICGRNRNDFFMSNHIGIWHYNGFEFQLLYKYPKTNQIETLNGIIFENEVFFLANDFTSGKSYIIHGK
jgi:hypothetical protein